MNKKTDFVWYNQYSFNNSHVSFQLSNDSKALLNIIGGKGALSNINYYYYYYYPLLLSCVMSLAGHNWPSIKYSSCVMFVQFS